TYIHVFFSIIAQQPRPTLFPYTTLFRSKLLENAGKLLTPDMLLKNKEDSKPKPGKIIKDEGWWFTNWSDDPTISGMLTMLDEIEDRKSTRLNSSHVSISYAVFCLKKKKN